MNFITPVTILGFLVLALGLTLLWSVFTGIQVGRQLVLAERQRDVLGKTLSECVNRVDPWELQRKLMEISGQDRPVRPMLTDNSLLYAALMLEELAETLKPIGVQLQRAATSTYDVLPADRIKGQFAHIAHLMTMHSVAIRQELERKPGICLEWDEDLALEAFDGTTDTAVVNAGFAIASGFPGAEGYAEVQNSNLSKGNPETGLIDKTADGKWIKGSNYQKPDLEMVLLVQRLDRTDWAGLPA